MAILEYPGLRLDADWSEAGWSEVANSEDLKHTYVKEPAHFDLWLVAPQEHSRGKAESSSLHLTRFHMERATMMGVCAALSEGRFDQPGGAVRPAASDELQNTLSRGFEFLGRARAYGRDQEGLLRALQADFEANADEWDALRVHVDKMRPALASRVENIYNMMGKTEVHVGDRFENIRGSTIVNRSLVDSQLRLLQGTDSEEVVAALGAIADAVVGSNSPVASEAFEDLLTELNDERRPAVLRTRWQRVLQHAPAVSALSAAVSAVATVVG